MQYVDWQNSWQTRKKTEVMYSFVYSNFNNCPLVWHFSSCESLQKIEKIQNCFLRLVLGDYESDHGNLIEKNGTTTMKIKRLRTLATEIFRAINNINHSYMRNIFTPKTTTQYHS